MSRKLREWTVDWWAGRGGTVGSVLDVALRPAEALFASAISIRNGAYDRGWIPRERPRIPVVSIGNLSVGGVGKTPFAAWTARTLADLGVSPAIVLRGYGSDEVLVHEELNPDIPVFATRYRIDGAVLAADAGRTAVVLDDGFQHRGLARDLDIVLVSADSWSARRRLLPRGPWRESITALKRAHVVVVTRKSAPAEKSDEIIALVREQAPEALFVTCHLAPTGLVPLYASGEPSTNEWLRGRAVLAVASLGDPDAFVRQLEIMGGQVELMPFPDHHEFIHDDVADILARAEGRPVIVTRKEAVKLRGIFPPTAVFVLEQQVELETGKAELLEALRRAVGR